jgi:hypothetical protein
MASLGSVGTHALTDPALLSQDHWSRLAPDLHICDADYLNSFEECAYSEADLGCAKEQLLLEGYFQLPQQTPPTQLAAMASLVRKLDTQGLPTPLSFLYDEFWTTFLCLNPLLEFLLGPGFLRLPDFWTWCVDPHKSGSGWPPHRDKGYTSLFEDGTPRCVSVWIPITDATTLNGCMYIVPADRDPTYGTPEDTTYSFALQDVRALPAPAGTVMGWNQAIVHWGSHASQRAPEPRISAAIEYQSGATPLIREAAMDPYSCPDFQSRLQLIGTQLLQYRHMHPLTEQTYQLAQRLVAPRLNAV